MRTATSLLIIDPQVDFCSPDGALYVPGADADMVRLSSTIRRLRSEIDSIHVTLDSHHPVHIANPIFWINSDGEHPAPFTTIRLGDIEDSRWRAFRPALQAHACDYVRLLEENGRYSLTIWPPHCLIGSLGHAVAPALFEALLEWESDFAIVDYVLKGQNSGTEHYSAIRADVPDPTDPATQTNVRLVEMLEQADVVGVAGEALTHCVANTVRDIAACFRDPDSIAKLVLLQDATSSIPGFERQADEFLAEMTSRGMRISSSSEFLA